jgi:peptide deformylase
MILDIVQYGHPVLRERCKPVAEVDDKLRQLVADMLETMYDANGVGLAAPQVGVALRLAVVDVAHDPECITFLKVGGQDAPLESIMPLVFINPELEFTGPKERDLEGCLSIQDVRAEVNRPGAIKAKLPQLDGTVLEIETDGLLARAIQHETDHLNGVLFIDRVSPAAKIGLRRKLRRLMAGE